MTETLMTKRELENAWRNYQDNTMSEKMWLRLKARYQRDAVTRAKNLVQELKTLVLDDHVTLDDQDTDDLSDVLKKHNLDVTQS